MKADLKPATAKVRSVLRKLEALAERGVDGEKLVAQRKIARLKARFDLDSPDPDETSDLFQGTFKRSSKARWIYSFPLKEFEVANAVKWAIERATGVHCLHRDRDLLAEAAPSTASKLTGIAEQIAQSFRTLIAKFSTVDGVSLADRGVFIRGLYDGMMNDPRDVGQPLASRPRLRRRGRAKQPAASTATGLHVHPYTLAFGLGRQIRFSVPVQAIAAELDGHSPHRLPGGAGTADAEGSRRNSRRRKPPSALPGNQ